MNIIATQAPLTEKNPIPSQSSYPFGIETSAALIAVGVALWSVLKAKLAVRATAHEAEAALIKSLQSELVSKDEEIDKQRVLIWKLEKEVRMLHQVMEFSGSPSPKG